MKVFDCFTFFNEFELLEIRLHELSPFVSKFVLVESKETFTGNRKPLWFTEELHKYKWSDREEGAPEIILSVSSPAPNPKNAWDREAHQRNSILDVLRHMKAEEDDLILLSDVDEIPRGQNFEELWKRRHRKKVFMQFWQDPYFFFMNLRGPRIWPGTVIITMKSLAEVYGNNLHALRLNRRHGDVVRNGGWHFSFMGGIEKSILKYKSYSHAPNATEEMLNPDSLGEMIRKGVISTHSRGHVQCKWQKIDDTYPKWFVENQERFKDMIRI